MNAIILFIVCTAVNVILSTIKSIATIKGGKFIAALMNALTYGFYSWVIILTTNDNLSTVSKMLITAACNFIGVYIVKLIEEKTRKEKLWKIEATVKLILSQMRVKIKNSFSIIPPLGSILFLIFIPTPAAIVRMLPNFSSDIMPSIL